MLINRKSGWLVCAVIFIGAIVWLNEQDTPENHMSGELKSMKTMALMKKYDPQSWQKIYDELLLIEKNNKDPHKVAALLIPVTENFVLARLPFSADKDVIAYGKSSVERLTIIAKNSKEDCLRAIDPSIDGPVNGATLLKIFPWEMRERFDKASSDMIISSYSPDKHQVSESETQQATNDIGAIIKNLRERFGSDFDYWQESTTDLSKSSVVCDIELAFWQQVLSTPAPRAAAIIRKLNMKAE
ncbi:hypothetical protein FO131_10625 [Salmonella bongori]|uniref:hypothetical protein n=1 Tax=Salmonella bongori TaxID=54736 RepID=UPI00127CE490|nr:hypothetical protein [Salmonella bongori]ECG8257851.1 hypothetical protein [Salmonella bongori serovar 48:i:-]ECG9253001.1 hypothetical protein [Salmonella bongori]EDP8706233.1 hypothetical protein [Salmonella bongori]EDP8726119.1 hypothetical protein [Salmonella bongori]EEO9370579.1 hypothetical protein [Salmonella bongori]